MQGHWVWRFDPLWTYDTHTLTSCTPMQLHSFMLSGLPTVHVCIYTNIHKYRHTQRCYVPQGTIYFTHMPCRSANVSEHEQLSSAATVFYRPPWAPTRPQSSQASLGCCSSLTTGCCSAGSRTCPSGPCPVSSLGHTRCISSYQAWPLPPPPSPSAADEKENNLNLHVNKNQVHNHRVYRLLFSTCVTHFLKDTCKYSAQST